MSLIRDYIFEDPRKESQQFGARRKFLVIVMDLNNLAAGIVFWRLLKAMAEYVDCELVSPCVMPEKINGLVAHKQYKYFRLPYRIEQHLYKRKGYYLTDNLWAKVTYKSIIKHIRKNSYDGVLSFVYGGNYAPLILGNIISEDIKTPWIVYSVDAIPTPISWTKDLQLRAKLLNYLECYIKRADAFFSSNLSMLRYEKNTFRRLDGYLGVVLTPSGENSNKKNLNENHKTITFLYAGYLYGPRKVGLLLRAFERFQKEKPNAKLIFVGNHSKDHFSGFEHLIKEGVVECYGFTKDIEPFYQMADVLIDLNADIINDVFLSSKVCNYLSYEKPILVISQDGSPVREIMSGCDSIIHTHHDEEEIYESLRKVSKCIGEHISDREELLQLFKPKNIAEKFLKEMLFSILEKNE